MNIVTLKKAATKLDSCLCDLQDMLENEDTDITDEEKFQINADADVCSSVLANIINMIKRSNGDEDEFINDMDSIADLDIEDYPDIDSHDVDLLNEIIVDN